VSRVTDSVLSTSTAVDESISAERNAAVPPTAPWSQLKLATFRFGFVALLLFIGHDLISFVPITALGTKTYQGYEWLRILPAKVLGGLWPAECVDMDSPYYCWTFDAVWYVFLAAVVALVWTLIDRRSTHYRRLHELLRIALRYSMARTMLGFGWVKLTGSQFGVGPEGVNIVLSVGERFAPNLMWQTMGYSFAYQAFTGVGEVLVCLLLLWRRTTSLGAMLLIVIAGVIMALTGAHRHPYAGRTFFYVVMAVVLLAPDAKRLFALYIQNRAVPNFIEAPLLRGRWGIPVQRTIKLTVLVYFFAYMIVQRSDRGTNNYWTSSNRAHPLAGLYEVDEFVRNGTAVPLRFDDSTRWRYVDISSGARYASNYPPHEIGVIGTDDVIRRYAVAYDSTHHALVLQRARISRLWGSSSGAIGDTLGVLTYQTPADSMLTLDGKLIGDSLTIRLKRLRVESLAERYRREKTSSSITQRE
jgi:hypothetical protein